MKKKIVLIATLLCFSTLIACGGSYKASDSAYAMRDYATENYKSDYITDAPMASGSYYAEKESMYDYSKGYDEGYDGGYNSTSSAVTDSTVIEANEAASKRKVIKTANLQVETLEFDDFVAKLDANINSFGGYIESSYVSGNNIYQTSSRYASYTIRVPEDKITGFIDQVGTLGNVTNKQYGEQDITLTYVDVESRIKTLQTEQETLLGLLEKAEYLTDIIELERRLSEVNYDIESYTSRLRSYDSQITYSTVSLSVTEVERITPVVKEPVVEKTLGEKIAISFKENLNDIWDGIQRFIIWFITHIIGICIWAVIIVAVVLFIKRGAKKKKEKQIAEMKMKAEINAEAQAKYAQSHANETNMGNQK